MNLILDAKNRQIIKGVVKVDVKITRIVGGVTLPFNCYLMNGTYLGSCVYNDLCGFIKSFYDLDENNCPQNLIDNDVPCKCPFDLPIRELNINHYFNLLPVESTLFSLFAQGDFDVTIKGTIGSANILCLNVKFAMKPI